MNKLILIVALAFTSLFFYSCDKDKDVPATKTKTELLTQSSWKFKAASATGIGDVSNQDPPFKACRKDNIITFTINGAGTIAEGATSCTPAEGAAFTWNFTNNEATLHFSAPLYPNAPNDVTFVSVTETELVISFPYTVSPGVILTVTVTFQH